VKGRGTGIRQGSGNRDQGTGNRKLGIEIAYCMESN
jgi:hypothetical protein